MTEKEKMLAGLLYNSMDQDLIRLRQHTELLVKRLNRDEETSETRNRLLKELLGSLGCNSELTFPIRFDYGFNTHIGDYCYFNFNVTILDCAEVRFGNNVLVGPNVQFLTPLHPLLARERRIYQDNSGHLHCEEYARPIHIANDVWIGAGVIINPGVHIGEGSVIGSGSVVTKDIPNHVLAVGNPCRVLRNITENDSTENL
ncbi:MAG: sugar O-acetyltransferase [Planctomycetia bacterium]|nr:sugar O-acetyltransferase [Planctomycetia bacterium]